MQINNKIGLGSVQFGMPYGVSNVDGKTSVEEVKNILDFATNVGINFIDTASSYGNAQKVLGLYDLTNFKVVSKFMPQDESNSIEIQFLETAKQLNIDKLYGYLAHRPLDLIANPKQWDALLKLKDENKIKKIGFSLNEPKELELLLNIGMIPDIVQVPYNYFDNRFKDFLIELKDKGCETHIRSAFLQGLFFANVQKLPDFFDVIKNNITELQTKYGNNLSEILLKYVLEKDFIDVVIMGVNNKTQLHNNLKRTNLTDYLTENSFNLSNSILMPSNWPKI